MSGEPNPNAPIRLTLASLGMIVGDIATSTKRFVREMIEGAMQPLHQEIRELTARVQALESVKYCGTWQRDVSYKAGASVTCRDGLWIAKIDSRGSRPGESAAWQLALRRGRSDGKDHHNAPQ